MKVLAINSVPYGSTAKIMIGIGKCCEKSQSDIHYFTATGFSTHSLKEMPSNNIIIGGGFSKLLHILLSKLTGYNGCYSILSTYLFLKKVNKIKPDCIHLHNLHGWYINVPMLFNYIKKKSIPVIWTLHDSWAFTGQCPYFTMVGCDKWKEGCFKCVQYKRCYPSSLIDNTKKMWTIKKKWFNGVKKLTIVTPSTWLLTMVKQSFLKEYPITVIYNGIDLSKFKPTDSSIREKLHIEANQKMILGVALDWTVYKGIDIFVKLSRELDNNYYKIILVGCNDEVAKKLPSNIHVIKRTESQEELAALYSAADVFVNPTREEVLGLTNIEALACGTPVVSFNTGGCSETFDTYTGIAVERDNVNELIKAIENICKREYVDKKCVERATYFDEIEKYQDYIKLYELVEN